MKNKNEKITQILNELYELDASLKNYDKELKKIINHILKTKPETKFDEKFKQTLRREIMNRIQEIKEKKAKKLRLTSIFSLPTPAYALAGITMIVFVVGGIYFSQKSTPIALDFEGELSIQSLGKNAFGVLSSENAMLNGSDTVTGKGAGSFSVNEQAAVSSSQAGVGAGGDSRLVLPAPDFVNYSYVYKGEDFEIETDRVNILKRRMGDGAAADLAKLITSADLGLVDLSSFRNSKVEVLNLVEDKDFGYSVYVNFYEGVLSIYKNWRNWPENRLTSLSQDDLPSDQALINIADSFLKEHNINIDVYGEPEVNKDWQVFLEEKSEGQVHIPLEIQVIYPLEINGEKVYEPSGQVHGASLAIDLNTKKVVSLYNLSTQSYDQSSYKSASKEKILEVAREGGINNFIRYQNGAKTVEVEIEKPTKGYMKYWQPTLDGRPNELIVPALIFKIKDVPEDASFNLRKTIIVPLVEELLDEASNYPKPILERE